MEWFLHQWHGFMIVKLTGYSPERFLNLCNAKDIPIWNLEYRDGGYEFAISLKGFLKIRPLARKSHVRLRVRKRIGLPFFLKENRKRVGFLSGFILFFVLLYGLSLFLWDIQIEGNRKYTYEILTNYLKTQNITLGMQKSRIDCDALEASLRNSFPEISWAAARISGTRLLISIKENEVLSHIPEKDEIPCDLVASKAGVITKLVVRQGKAQVQAGDTVEAGQVLISGTIPIYDDSEQIKQIHYIRADGEVLADTEYEFSETFSRLHTVEADTGKVKHGISLKIGPWSAVFLLPAKEGEEWIYLSQEHQARLFSNFYLPVYWGHIRGRQVEYYESFYTEEEVKQVSEGIYQNFVKNLSEKGVQIIENNVKILEDGTECQMTGTIQTRESIIQVQRITIPEETEKINEHSGEHD